MSDLGPEARAVVEAGRAGDEPTEHDRARIRAALMAAIAAGSAGAATVAGEGAAAAGAAKGAAAAGTVALGWGWKALVVGVAVVGALGTGVAVIRAPAQAPRGVPSTQGIAEPAPPAPTGRAEPVPSMSTEAPLPSAPPPDRSAAPAPKVADGARSAPVRAPAPQAAAPQGGGDARDTTPAVSAAPAPTAPVPRPADSLAAELRALGEARGAIQGGDPAKALSLLDEQSSTYASGQLREERMAARVLALCKLGKKDEARALAARFLADNPRSPLADRVRGACAAGDSR